MKSSFISPGKFPGILLALFIIGFCFGCQKEPLTENTNESESAMLKSTKSNNYMVITKSESLPPDFTSKLTAYGKIPELNRAERSGVRRSNSGHAGVSTRA